MAEELAKDNGSTNTRGSRRARLRDAQSRRVASSSKKRDDGRNYSLEGMRFATVMNQLQALQALQGLKELAPRKPLDGKARFEISTNATERASQYQWLAFKADWLEALLADTLDQLDAMADFEVELRSLDSLRKQDANGFEKADAPPTNGRSDAAARVNGSKNGNQQDGKTT